MLDTIALVGLILIGGTLGTGFLLMVVADLLEIKCPKVAEWFALRAIAMCFVFLFLILGSAVLIWVNDKIPRHNIHYQSTVQWYEGKTQRIDRLQEMTELSRHYLETAGKDCWSQQAAHKEYHYWAGEHDQLIPEYICVIMRHCHGSQYRGVEKTLPKELGR